MPAARALVNALIHPMGPPRSPPDGGQHARPDDRPAAAPPWASRAEAILWQGDTILAVGASEDVRAAARRIGATVEDARGRLVLPGFVDAHMHLIHAGMKLLRPDLRGARSLEEALGSLDAWLRGHPGPDAVTGEGWDESGWTERRWPARGDLDAVCAAAGQPERPVVLRRIDGHVAVANSAALTVVRRRWDSDALVDRKTGVLLEDASLYLNEALPAPDAAIDAALDQACRIAHPLGVTAVGDYSQAPFRAALVRAAAQGRLRLRVASSLYVQAWKSAVSDGFRTGREAGPFLRDGGLKLFLDGSLGAHTAALRGTYQGAQGARGGKGRLNWKDAELLEWVRQAQAAGCQVHAHAIGDAAIDQALWAFEEVGRQRGEGLGALRHRIEHCEITHDDQLRRMARLGIVASSQPNFVGEWSGEGGMYEARLGEAFRLNNRFQSMKRLGVALAFGSDCMPFGPLVGMQAAVGHPVAAERMAPLEAAWHYTWMAAWSLHWEGRIGSLAPGKLVDLVVIDGAPDRPPQEWAVEQTILGGATVYRRGGPGEDW